jgi:homogentisate 1,2-dioxygenase
MNNKKNRIMAQKPNYLYGFDNHHMSEARPKALPIDQNSPQKAPQGLVAEQLSGAAFTENRHENRFTWLYRQRPSVSHGEFSAYRGAKHFMSNIEQAPPPTQMRWDPLPYPSKATDFIDGLVTFAHNGSVKDRIGANIHLYAINDSMHNRYFYCADGEWLFVPQEGGLRLLTEMGVLEIMPGEIAVVPRGIKYQVRLLSDQARGYICENAGAPFRLPELGPIGANGLASARHFAYPQAHFEERSGKFKLITKFLDKLWVAPIDHSPLDVVAWHGKYAPYKYDCKLFNTMSSVSFDHPDPSIFTVLTSPSLKPGVANIDFVIFPERWLVSEHTFRPPYFHRNVMSEYMGLVHGIYDAKPGGFVPGGGSLHNCMTAHGPDKNAFKRASERELKPEYYRGTLAFMFESCYVWQPTKFALTSSIRQKDYLQCWTGL